MARTDAEKALRPYVQHLNRLLNKTITESKLSVLQGQSAFRVVTRVQDGSRILPLELRPRGRWLHFRQQVRVRPDGRITVEAAIYKFSHSADPDDEDAWLFMYHYNRGGRPGQPQSHLHVSGRHGRPAIDLNHLHFPTGRISLEQIIAHLITDQKVACRMPEEEALSLLRSSHRSFVRLRTDEAVFP